MERINSILDYITQNSNAIARLSQKGKNKGRLIYSISRNPDVTLTISCENNSKYKGIVLHMYLHNICVDAADNMLEVSFESNNKTLFAKILSQYFTSNISEISFELNDIVSFSPDDFRKINCVVCNNAKKLISISLKNFYDDFCKLLYICSPDMLSTAMLSSIELNYKQELEKQKQKDYQERKKKAEADSKKRLIKLQQRQEEKEKELKWANRVAQLRRDELLDEINAFVKDVTEGLKIPFESSISREQFSREIGSLQEMCHNSIGTTSDIQIKFGAIKSKYHKLTCGDHYLGGIIIHLEYFESDHKWHGIISADRILSHEIWGVPYEYKILSNIFHGLDSRKSEQLWMGKDNTELISLNLSHRYGLFKKTMVNTASSFCQQLVYSGHQDWVLPSKDELELLLRFVDFSTQIPRRNIKLWSSSFDINYYPYCAKYDNAINSFNISHGKFEDIYGVCPVRYF